MTYGVGPGLYPRLRFALAFWSLRFGSAFWFCVLLIEDISCVLPREDSTHFKTWLRFVSRLTAFCLKTYYVLSRDFLRFVSRPSAFCLKTYCILSQDLLCFVSRLLAFCLLLKTFLCILTVLSGKENGVNILKSIDEGPFQMGTVRETLADGTEGAPHLGPERPRVYSDLSPEEKDRYNAKIRATNILLQGLPKDIYTLINHYTDAKDIWDNVKMLLTKERPFMTTMSVDPLALMSNVSHQQHYSQSYSTPPFTYVPPYLADNAHLDSSLSPTNNLIKNLSNTLALLTQSYKHSYLKQTINLELHLIQGTKLQFKMVELWFRMFKVDRIEVRGPIHGMEVQLGYIARNYTQPKRPQNFDYYKDKMLLMQAQEKGDLALNVDNVFQADDCDVLKIPNTISFHTNPDQKQDGRRLEDFLERERLVPSCFAIFDLSPFVIVF
nr:integrase, catalytic region, zinc finger, CCHC-type, peptidase aspartic, catalytic [Tanacetum cinerariifolium]